MVVINTHCLAPIGKEPCHQNRQKEKTQRATCKKSTLDKCYTQIKLQRTKPGSGEPHR